MNLSYDRIKNIFPQFNVVALSESDFWSAAKHEKIVVRQEPLLVDGYYTRRRGKHIILIDSRLSGLKWLHTAFHELFHYYLDVPPGKCDVTLYRSKAQIRSKQETTVDALSLAAIVPMTDLVRYEAEDLTDDYYLAAAVRDRIVVRAELRF